jgi:hypothetical protein
MPLSASYRSTIIKVSVIFGFDGFACDPDEITASLRISPDGVGRKGSKRRLRNGQETIQPISYWSIVSRSKSKDVNVHIREVLARVAGRQSKVKPEFGCPGVSVTWFGDYLYAGSGPFYEADVIQTMASWKARLWHDIYQIDQADNPSIAVGKLRLRRPTKKELTRQMHRTPR